MLRVEVWDDDAVEDDSIGMGQANIAQYLSQQMSTTIPVDLHHRGGHAGRLTISLQFNGQGGMGMGMNMGMGMGGGYGGNMGPGPGFGGPGMGGGFGGPMGGPMGGPGYGGGNPMNQGGWGNGW
eukprot:TRINITY_DN3007_c0_g1_i2.p1 TRINITY_DN3007_c0_g1~~TRINITY_DN3007_c0_g1_i2.p1  ORF type:complete len:124 (+),score=16.86 TRINITY_DN3007_c0_g1_i2:201-572(+)